jgi:hypothetical protein
MFQEIKDTIRNDVAAAKSAYNGLGVVASFFSFMQGRATTFAVVFTVCGLIGFFKHYDLTSYAIFVGAIFTGVVGHSLKEDYFEMRRKKNESTEKGDTI